MADLPFPLQFQRQFAGPLDLDGVFVDTAALTAYLTNPRRYAGMVVTCLDQPGIVFILNAALDTWLTVGGSLPSNVAYTDALQTFSAAQRGAEYVLTDDTSITINMAFSNNFVVTLGGNRTLASPLSGAVGQSGFIRVRQSGGPWTLGYSSNWDFTDGVPPVLGSVSGATYDLLAYYMVSGTNGIISLAGSAVS